jgi:hypothetical protein
MKKLAASLALLFAVSIMHAQASAPAAAVTTKIPVAKPDEPKAAPTKPGVTTKAPAKKEEKKEEEPVIPGANIARPNGTWLGLEVVNGNFKLSFYDEKKKPLAVDVTRATARWPNPRAPGDNRTVLNVSGTALVGAKPVIPPFNFTVFLTLLKGEGDEAKAVETYQVPFRG